MRAIFRSISLGLVGVAMATAWSQTIELRPGGPATPRVSENAEPSQYGGVSQNRVQPNLTAPPASAPQIEEGRPQSAAASVAGAQTVANASQVVKSVGRTGAPWWSKVLFGAGAGLTLLIGFRVMMDRWIPVENGPVTRAKRDVSSG